MVAFVNVDSLLWRPVMGNFRISHVNGAKSLGIIRVPFDGIYTESSSNKVRTLNGGECDELKQNLDTSYDALGIVDSVDKIIVESMPDGRYRVVDGNNRFGQISKNKASLLDDDGMIEVELVQFNSTLSRTILQCATNLPLANKSMKGAECAKVIYEASLKGELNIHSDVEINDVIEQMAPDRSKSWKGKVRNAAKKQGGIPVEFTAFNEDKQKEFLAKSGRGTAFSYNEESGTYDAVLKNDTSWRVILFAVTASTESEYKTKTRVVIGLSGAPAKGDFNAARRKVEDECRKGFENFQKFFRTHGPDASLDTFLEFTGKAFPQDGLTERDSENTNRLVDIV